MTQRVNEALRDPEVRRTFEEELLVGEATDTVGALLESLGMPQRELAERLGVSAGRVSQILSGEENLTLRSLAGLGWALGIQFEMNPTPMADRAGTPAEDDPPLPAWLSRLRPQGIWQHRAHIELPTRGRVGAHKPRLRVVGGEVRAA